MIAICPKCGNKGDFLVNKGRKDGFSKYCKVCINLAAKEARKRRILGLPSIRKSKYDSINTAKYSVNLKLRYGITLEQYNQMLVDQKECCAICNKHKSEFKSRLHVDHNHKTGKVRGLLCVECNQGLGKFKDNKQLLQVAIEYLGND